MERGKPRAVNLAAPINKLGYGQVGWNLLRAMGGDADVSLFPIGAVDVDGDGAEVAAAVRRAETFDANAPSLRVWHQNDLAHRVGRGPAAGFPFFETVPLQPVEVHHANSLDLYVVASQWAKRAAEESGVKTPIVVAPLGVDRSIFHPAESRRPFGPGEQTTVFFTVGKWEKRKGHDLLIEAFNRAFEPMDDVQLRLCCHNPFLGVAGNMEWLRLAMTSKMGRAGKIEVSRDRLATQADVAAFINDGDVGVFPSRAEGWNLDLLETLSCGKHVIATNYSAHTEFCNTSNSFLLPIDGLETARDDVWFHGRGEWAKLGDGAMDWLVIYMKMVHLVKQRGGDMFNRAGVETAEQFSWRRTAEVILESLFNV